MRRRVRRIGGSWRCASVLQGYPPMRRSRHGPVLHSLTVTASLNGAGGFVERRTAPRIAAGHGFQHHARRT